MAKTEDKSTSEQAVEAVLEAFSFGGFKFAPKITTTVSEDTAGARTGGVDALPFMGYFKAVETVALEGKIPELFVPLALFQARHEEYWKGRNQPNQIKAQTPAIAKDKLKGEFKKYQDEKDAPEVRKGLRLGFAIRTGKEGIDGIDQPGLTMWVLKVAGWKPAPKEEPKAPEPEAPKEEPKA